MVYLVDFENTRMSGLRGGQNLSMDDLVIIFVTPACNVDITLYKLAKCAAPIMIDTCDPLAIKEYLDKRIIYVAGRLHGMGKADICIVSADKGYAVIKDFLMRNNLFTTIGDKQLNLTLQKTLGGGDVFPPHSVYNAKRMKEMIAEDETSDEIEDIAEQAEETPDVVPTTAESVESAEPTDGIDLETEFADVVKEILQTATDKRSLMKMIAMAFGKPGMILYEKYADGYPDEAPVETPVTEPDESEGVAVQDAGKKGKKKGKAKDKAKSKHKDKGKSKKNKKK